MTQTTTEQAVRALLRLSAHIQASGCDEAVSFLLALRRRPDLAQIIAGRGDREIELSEAREIHAHG
jgi:hypothetical protein